VTKTTRRRRPVCSKPTDRPTPEQPLAFGVGADGDVPCGGFRFRNPPKPAVFGARFDLLRTARSDDG
jgi:hypothetical protein